MEIRLLGLVEASHEGRDVPLGGAKPRALLSMLALQANAPVAVDRLIEGLWGERPPATAPKLVQVMVSQLRKQLVDADAEIVTRGRGYELRLDPDRVDALLFERLLRQGEGGPRVWEALALWRGPPLDDRGEVASRHCRARSSRRGCRATSPGARTPATRRRAALGRRRISPAPAG
jgi:DNA-binding SARP family transcriptional activator